MRQQIKAAAGQLVAASLPQARYERCLFLIGHMRCGSTALSNVLTSHRAISGYGEAHVPYRDRSGPGRLVVNQALRRSWSPGAALLFDKILHNRHDDAPPPGFFAAHALFLLRPPGPTIASILRLYATLGRDEYSTASEAAAYYTARVTRMAALWDAFPAARRTGLTHGALTSDPNRALARLSERLTLSPPLENSYASRAQSRAGGAGDPLRSGTLNRIAATPEQGPDISDLPLGEAERQAALAAHEAMESVIRSDAT